MKRWGYEWREKEESTQLESTVQPHVKRESLQETKVIDASANEPALWGVDLEALRKANQPGLAGPHKTSSAQLPIYRAESARAYLLKAFETPRTEGAIPTKRTVSNIAAEKARNLSLLLGALELLYQSWASILSKEDLDKRAWGWYVRIRPEVASGAAGWGGKGNVKLSEILELRRPSG